MTFIDAARSGFAAVTLVLQGILVGTEPESTNREEASVEPLNQRVGWRFVHFTHCGVSEFARERSVEPGVFHE